MALIDRTIINPRIQVTSLSIVDNNIVKTITSYNELLRSIDQAKAYLINERNCKPGQKVILCNFYWPSYLAWFFACAELGLPFVVSDYPKSESALKKLELYGDIDYIIFDYHYPPAFNKFPEKLIDSNLVNNYPVEDTPVWATDDSIVMLSTSSGTTGTPKVVSHTHGFFNSLLERNAKLYGLKESDRCFHSKGLHHGSVTGVYFLPSIKYCANHYHAPFKFIPSDVDYNEEVFMQAWANLIQEERINKCIMFYDQLDYLNNLLQLDNKQHDDLLVYVIAKIKQEHIDNLVGTFGYRIESIFGCTETSGPLFLPSVTPVNYKTYDPQNFGPLLDDFYSVSLDSGLLNVKMPTGDIICTGDKFVVDQENYIFHGRDNLYRVNGKTVYLNLLNDAVEQLLRKKKELDFDIVFDKSVEKIYIRSTQDVDLDELNQNLFLLFDSDCYSISAKVIAPREQFFYGIKFDPEAIRFCVKESNNVQE